MTPSVRHCRAAQRGLLLYDVVIGTWQLRVGLTDAAADRSEIIVSNFGREKTRVRWRGRPTGKQAWANSVARKFSVACEQHGDKSGDALGVSVWLLDE